MHVHLSTGPREIAKLLASHRNQSRPTAEECHLNQHDDDVTDHLPAQSQGRAQITEERSA